MAAIAGKHSFLMHLILVRHGNTFEENQTPFYVGGRTDLPLTVAGLNQANTFAEAMKNVGIYPAKIYCSELQRTQQHMKPLTELFGLAAATPDARLNEMDYGTWEAKTNEEVDAMYGSDAPRKAWDKQGIRPADAGFLPSEASIRANIESLVNEICATYNSNDVIVVCSSNGIIRYFLQLVPDAYDKALNDGTLKVATGSVGALNMQPDRALSTVLFWNKKPSEAPLGTL